MVSAHTIWEAGIFKSVQSHLFSQNCSCTRDNLREDRLLKRNWNGWPNCFLAFWLRSRVVSVLITLISEKSSVRRLYLKRIFVPGCCTQSLLLNLLVSGIVWPSGLGQWLCHCTQHWWGHTSSTVEPTELMEWRNWDSLVWKRGGWGDTSTNT